MSRGRAHLDDPELERLLRETLHAAPDEAEPSLQVMEAVMDQVRRLPRQESAGAASRLTTLALALGWGTALAWLAIRFWAARAEGLAGLVEGSFARLVGSLLLWLGQSVGQATKTLLALGFGGLFPLALLGLLAGAALAFPGLKVSKP